ncbi:MAG: dicarboxylate/amino acid:cation symporter [Bryobacteraceae bacterium]|nr:dicarboxylate/amino acid:cation symporter [Bryobacteraceae bacterium]
MALHHKILIGMAAGLAAGLTANLGGIEWLRTVLGNLEPLGLAFIRLITMIVVPLVVASIVAGAASIGDLSRLGRVGAKAVVFYLFTTAAAAALGLILSDLVRPGSRIDPATRDALAARLSGSASEFVQRAEPSLSFTGFVLKLIPRNPVQAAAEFDLLPLIFFALIFGAAVATLSSERRAPIVGLMEAVSQACTVIIHWVMKLAPYAVFALIAVVSSRFGVDLLRSLLVYTLLVLGGLALHNFLVLAPLVRVTARIGPREFFRRIAAVQLFAFSTSSSNATLPLTLETAERKLGVSNGIARFVLPLGATINMDGTALYQAIAVMFIAQIYAVPMSLSQHLTIVLTVTLAAIGTAGVPGAGVIMLIIVLQSVGLGAQAETGIALILGVDRILDMARTVINVTGDLACAAFVARSEGEELLPPLETAEAES